MNKSAESERTATTTRHGGGVDLEPEAVLPTQFFPRIQIDASLQPEKRLMLAVLEDAVRVWRKVGNSTSKRGHRVRTELREWFSSPSTESPFAFESVCLVLDLDSGWARAQLQVPGAPVRVAVSHRDEAAAGRWAEAS